MAEPLAVDPARLLAAGGKLAELVFPTVPSPIAATGSDSVSAAINETMPGIESLVSEGLPGVTAALKRTASSMTTAADIYTKADQSLGDALRQSQFASDAQALGAGAAVGVTGATAKLLSDPGAQMLGAPGGAAAQVSQVVAQQVSELQPRVAATVPQVVQLAPQAAQMGQQMSPIAQTISQSAQQAGQQGSQAGGAAPAQLVDDTKKDDEDKDGEGEAAAGDGALGSAPTEGAAGGSTPAGSLATPI